MKIGILKSIGHNIADSLVSGIGLMIGVYQTDIFGEASRNSDGFITIDFLNGAVISGQTSESLRTAIKLYGDALPELCQKHGADKADFRKLEVRFGTNIYHQKRFIVAVEDNAGKSSIDTYYGSPGVKSKKSS